MDHFRETWKEIWESTKQLMAQNTNDKLDLYDYIIMGTILLTTIIIFVLASQW